MESTACTPSPGQAAVALPAGAFYLPQLDTFRFAAFFMVFICHTFPRSPESYASVLTPTLAKVMSTIVAAGGFGVSLFFALSAYLITELLVRERRTTGALDIRSFYIRRALRIWPLYYAFVLIGFMLQDILPIGPFSPKYLGSLLVFMGNWTIVLYGYPSVSFALLWSLCVEEQFYLVWPAMLKLFSGTSLQTFAIGMLGISVTSRLVFALLDLPFSSVWCATTNHLDSIAVGVLVASGWRPIVGNAPTTAILGFAMIIAAQAIGSIVGEQWGPSFSFPAVSLACGLIISGSLGVKLKSRKLAYLGKISFGLYVFHEVVHAVALHYLIASSPGAQLLRVAIVFAGTLVLAMVSYEFYEKPFLRIKARFAHVASRPA